jgi:hypothetical protein
MSENHHYLTLYPIQCKLADEFGSLDDGFATACTAITSDSNLEDSSSAPWYMTSSAAPPL